MQLTNSNLLRQGEYQFYTAFAPPRINVKVPVTSPRTCSMEFCYLPLPRLGRQLQDFARGGLSPATRRYHFVGDFLKQLVFLSLKNVSTKIVGGLHE